MTAGTTVSPEAQVAPPIAEKAKPHSSHQAALRRRLRCGRPPAPEGRRPQSSGRHEHSGDQTRPHWGASNPSSPGASRSQAATSVKAILTQPLRIGEHPALPVVAVTTLWELVQLTFDSHCDVVGYFSVRT